MYTTFSILIIVLGMILINIQIRKELQHKHFIGAISYRTKEAQMKAIQFVTWAALVLILGAVVYINVFFKP